MHRFYLKSLTDKSTQITLTDPKEIHHLKSVLRLKKGSLISIFNGAGLAGTGRLESVSNTDAKISVSKFIHAPDSKGYVILACAIPKKAKFETIIEKCTELGVDEIVPLLTKRTEIKLDDTRKHKKHLRFQTVAVNAAKQSKRTTLPTIHPITSFADALPMIDSNTIAIIPWLKEKSASITRILKKTAIAQPVMIFIGPEGDFTDEEIKVAQKSGCLPVTLGPTVLKVDTAAIASVTLTKLLLNL